MAEKAANRKLNWSWKEILLLLKIIEIKRRKKWKVSANKINASKKRRHTAQGVLCIDRAYSITAFLEPDMSTCFPITKALTVQPLLDFVHTHPHSSAFSISSALRVRICRKLAMQSTNPHSWGRATVC